ncbi:hypothetical protein D3C85_1673310 [compost metagenome]
MDHRIDRIFGKQPGQQCAIAHIALLEQRRLAGDLRQALEHTALAVAEVVKNDKVFAGRSQLDAGV